MSSALADRWTISETCQACVVVLAMAITMMYCTAAAVLHLHVNVMGMTKPSAAAEFQCVGLIQRLKPKRCTEFRISDQSLHCHAGHRMLNPSVSQYNHTSSPASIAASQQQNDYARHMYDGSTPGLQSPPGDEDDFNASLPTDDLKAALFGPAVGIRPNSQTAPYSTIAPLSTPRVTAPLTTSQGLLNDRPHAAMAPSTTAATKAVPDGQTAPSVTAALQERPFASSAAGAATATPSTASLSWQLQSDQALTSPAVIAMPEPAFNPGSSAHTALEAFTGFAKHKHQDVPHNARQWNMVSAVPTHDSNFSLHDNPLAEQSSESWLVGQPAARPQRPVVDDNPVASEQHTGHVLSLSELASMDPARL